MSTFGLYLEDENLIPTPPKGSGLHFFFIGNGGILKTKDENGIVRAYMTSSSSVQPEDIFNIVKNFHEDGTASLVEIDEDNFLIKINLNPTEIDHGSISGLGDDDHPHYHTDERGDARYYRKDLLDGGKLDSRYYTQTEIAIILNTFLQSSSVGESSGVAGLDSQQKLFIENIPIGIDHSTLASIGSLSHEEIETALSEKYPSSNPEGFETPAELDQRDDNNRSRENHTGTQAAETIDQDETHRFVSDLEKSTWDGKENSLGSSTSAYFLLGDRAWSLVSGLVDLVLTGLSLASSAAVEATDSILSAIGKLQAQINSHFGSGGNSHALVSTESHGFMSSDDKEALDALILSGGGGVGGYVKEYKFQLVELSSLFPTSVNIPSLSYDVEAGKKYMFEFCLYYKVMGTSTGFQCTVHGTYGGDIYIEGSQLTGYSFYSYTYEQNLFYVERDTMKGATSVSSTNQPLVSRMKVFLNCTTSGTFYPLFRSSSSTVEVKLLANSHSTVDVMN